MPETPICARGLAGNCRFWSGHQVGTDARVRRRVEQTEGRCLIQKLS